MITRWIHRYQYGPTGLHIIIRSPDRYDETKPNGGKSPGRRRHRGTQTVCTRASRVSESNIGQSGQKALESLLEAEEAIMVAHSYQNSSV